MCTQNSTSSPGCLTDFPQAPQNGQHKSWCAFIWKYFAPSHEECVGTKDFRKAKQLLSFRSTTYRTCSSNCWYSPLPSATAQATSVLLIPQLENLALRVRHDAGANVNPDYVAIPLVNYLAEIHEVLIGRWPWSCIKA